MRVPGLVLIVLLLAGCFAPTQTVYTSPICAAAFPDGSPKDCLRDDAVVALVPPQDWHCLDRVGAQGAAAGPGFTLMWDGAQTYGVAWQGAGDAQAIVRGEAAVHLDGAQGHIAFAARDGFSPVLDAPGSSGAWTAYLWSFQIVNATAGDTLEVRQQRWDGGFWYTATVAHGGKARVVDLSHPVQNATGEVVDYWPTDTAVAFGEELLRINATQLAHTGTQTFNTQFALIPPPFSCQMGR